MPISIHKEGNSARVEFLPGRKDRETRKIYERAIEEELRKLPGGCRLWSVSEIGRRTIPAVRDSRYRANYVARVANRTSDTTVKKIGRVWVGHRNYPSARIDEKCLDECGSRIMGVGESLGLTDETIEKAIARECSCKCKSTF